MNVISHLFGSLQDFRHLKCSFAGALLLVMAGSQVSYGQLADGTYKIINRNSGQALYALGGGTANGTKVVQYPYNGTTSAQWTLTSIGNGQYKLIGVASGRSINVTNNSWNSGVAVQLWSYQDTANDQITLVDSGDGYYTPVFVKSGLPMQVSTSTSTFPNGALAWNQPVLQNSATTPPTNSQWKFLPPTEGSTAGSDFSMVVMPDTQKEIAGVVGSTPQMFYDQINWINANRTSSNIQYVAGVGDIVDYGAIASQWTTATTGYYQLDNTVPYGLVAGNHDFDSSSPVFTLNNYNTHFGVSHYIDKAYYGGHSITSLGDENNNFYHLISSGGLDFVIVHMRYHAPGEQNSTSTIAEDLAWVNNVMQAHPNRRAIFVTHELIGNTGLWSGYGQATYDAIKGNPNLFLMLCGHIAPCNEAMRSDTYNGRTIHTLLVNYQNAQAPNFGGNGILRLLTFKPKENIVTTQTYSPTTNVWMHAASFPYQMHGEAAPLNTASPHYLIYNKTSGLAMELADGNTANGATIYQGATSTNNPNQQWTLVPTENLNHFKIISTVSGKALSVTGDSTANNALVQSWTYSSNNPGQQWDLTDAGNGWFRIRNVNSGLYLDNQWAGTTPGTLIWQRNGNSSDAQKWRVQPWGDYYLKTSSGGYVSTLSAGTTNETPIVQNTASTANSFRWLFNSAGEGLLKLASRARTSASIEVSGGASTAAAAPLQLMYQSQQSVRILPQTDGRVKFYWTHDGMSWEVPGNTTAPNTTLIQNPNVAESPEQEFRLQRVP
ncbi:RICIN domain-containing protein [Luteolibacter yonseiensis]|uniref:RICIN domain-containing protein n=1 Tax=Luteolibacter yonseiensis TaxID=1144680 RepID=A0A934R4K5_9BACT|nr:RICIN domain-containing protein [Luteolibacter yonseiensis]MBK1817031.1 RICIN domain-containing protein [Luteolibacter yonseiensis]